MSINIDKKIKVCISNNFIHTITFSVLYFKKETEYGLPYLNPLIYFDINCGFVKGEVIRDLKAIACERSFYIKHCGTTFHCGELFVSDLNVAENKHSCRAVLLKEY